MTKSFRIQENIYSTYLKLKTRKKQQQFLEKCFIFAWENREIETDYDVELAFSGVKPSIKLSENGGGLNNPKGINGAKCLKNKENDMSLSGQSEVRVRSDSGQTFISNKNKDISIKEEEINKEEYTQDFEDFWELYPKQRAGNKKKAYKAYCRVLKENRCTKEKLLDVVKKYRQCKDVKDGYAKGCEAWLNDDRFNWEYESTTELGKYWL